MKAEMLRKSILQYAIQGKLVPQIDTEEPAIELLKKIKAEKQELIKQGIVYKKKALAPFVENDIPFDIPNNWTWCYLSDVSTIQEGAGIRKFQYKNEGIQLLSVTNILDGGIDLCKKQLYVSQDEYENKYKHLTVNKGDIVTACSGGSWGKTAIYVKEDTVMLNTSTLRMRFFGDLGNNLYLYYITKSFCFKNQIEKQLSGMQPNFGYTHYSKVLVPLPPLEEQQRIVVRIEELMDLVDEYEKKEVELEKLEKEFPEKLKKSILQYAIQGKLVPRIDTEEPASELLKKIKAEKQELLKQGKIKKQKTLPPITDEEKPFDIPESWKWVRLREIFNHNTGKALNKSNIVGEKKEYLTTSNVYWNKIDLTSVKEMHFAEHELDKYSIKKGDLLVCEGGDVGRSAIWNIDKTICIQNHIHKLRSYKEVDNLFFLYVLYIYKALEYIGGKGIGIQGLSSNVLGSLIIPLPPLEEQKRIVSRIEELFDLVDMISSGKKLKIEEDKTRLKEIANVIELKPQLEIQKRVDVSSFGLVAREDGEVTQCDLDTALSEVQDFYDKKKN